VGLFSVNKLTTLCPGSLSFAAVYLQHLSALTLGFLLLGFLMQVVTEALVVVEPRPDGAVAVAIEAVLTTVPGHFGALTVKAKTEMPGSRLVMLAVTTRELTVGVMVHTGPEIWVSTGQLLDDEANDSVSVSITPVAVDVPGFVTVIK